MHYASRVWKVASGEREREAAIARRHKEEFQIQNYSNAILSLFLLFSSLFSLSFCRLSSPLVDTYNSISSGLLNFLLAP
jgi:hypothetical protein